MKLLLIGPQINDKARVKNYGGVWSYFLTKEFERLGIEFQHDDLLTLKQMNGDEMIKHYQELDVSGIDHVLAFGLRYFEKVPKACAESLRSRIKGAVTQIFDGSRLDRAPVNCTFTVRNDAWKYRGVDRERHEQANCYVGWAADPEVCVPKQLKHTFRILIDHPNLTPQAVDFSERILKDVKKFVESGIWQRRFSRISVRRIIDSEVEECDLNNIQIRPYKRKHLFFEEICREYAESDVFLPTHPESVGLTVLETAMCGALPVIQKGFLSQDRLSTVRHIDYKEVIPWRLVLDSLNPKASREEAMKNNWKTVARRIVSYFKGFSKND